MTKELDKVLDELNFVPDSDNYFVNQAIQFRELMMMYNCAIREVRTKLEVLNDELSIRNSRNPIEFIESRIKRPLSIVDKLKRYGEPVNVESIERSLNDVAGIRVICPFIDDIYSVADMLLSQDDITLIKKKDYIENPKPNGYRSLHLIVETPIFLHDQKRMMRVEVQFRTISMDWWASLEHKIRYKKDLPELDHVNRELFECAQMGAQLDARMEKLQRLAETAAAEQHTDSRWGERRSGPLMR